MLILIHFCTMYRVKVIGEAEKEEIRVGNKNSHCTGRHFVLVET